MTGAIERGSMRRCPSGVRTPVSISRIRRSSESRGRAAEPCRSRAASLAVVIRPAPHGGPLPEARQALHPGSDGVRKARALRRPCRRPLRRVSKNLPGSPMPAKARNRRPAMPIGRARPGAGAGAPAWPARTALRISASAAGPSPILSTASARPQLVDQRCPQRPARDARWPLPTPRRASTTSSA